VKLNTYVDKLKDAAEKLQGLVTSGASGVNIGAAIRDNQLAWANFAKDIDDSGIADEFGKLGFVAIFGPAGEIGFDLAVAARDGVAAGWGLYNNVTDAEAAQRTLDQLVDARRAIMGRLSEIDSILTSSDFNCAQPTPSPQDRIMTQPPAPDPIPAAPVAQAPQAKTPKKGGGGATAARVVVAGAGLGGALYALNKAKQISDSANGGGGSGSLTVTFVSASTINCTFNAGGIINSCTGTVTIEFGGKVSSGTAYRFQFDAGPGGNRTITSTGQVAFTISGGTGSQTCPTLRTGTVIDTSTQFSVGSFSNMPITVSCK
jgi:hypothetical protein